MRGHSSFSINFLPAASINQAVAASIFRHWFCSIARRTNGRRNGSPGRPMGWSHESLRFVSGLPLLHMPLEAPSQLVFVSRKNDDS